MRRLVSGRGFYTRLREHCIRNHAHTLNGFPKGPAKLGNIVAEILFLVIFPWVAKLGRNN